MPDRGKPVVGAHTRTVQDRRKTSRSQEIDVNSFHEETVSSERSGQPVVETSKTQTRSSDDYKSLNVETAHDRSGQPGVETNTENVPDGCETRSRHDSMRLNVEDETLRERSGQPVVNHDDSSHESIMLNEVNMDFRIPGLPHSVVKHAQSTSVRELIQKIENHPDRHALRRDLRQNQAYDPLSPESKKMIQDVGKIELFELLEMDPKTQCKACWSEGIVCCTCGHLLQETVANRNFVKYTMDLLSIPEYVIKKGRPHGHRYGKLPGSREYFVAKNLKKRCIKRQFKGIHDRFLRDHVFRERMIQNNRDEVCRAWDVLADEDHTYHMSQEEYFYYKNNWWLHLNKSGNDTQPLRKRSDFKQALSTLERLHQEAGGEQIEPVPYWKYKQWRSASSSSSTWWQWQDSWWSA